MEKRTSCCTTHLLFLLIGVLILSIVSCETRGPIPTMPKPGRKIKQSFTIHDDNVNGVVLRGQNISVREITNFYYNEHDLLDSLNAFDSTNTILVKSLKLDYNTPGKIRGYFFDYLAGNYVLDLYYNANYELTRVTDVFGLGWGIFVDYSNNKIIHTDLTLGATTSLTNFVYDSHDNLIQYIISDTLGQPNIKVQLEYDLANTIPEALDIRFAGVGLRYLYAGGVNVISLMGLNYGLGNTNRVVKRTETHIATNEPLRTFYESYSLNDSSEIIGKTLTLNDTIDVFYEYRY